MIGNSFVLVTSVVCVGYVLTEESQMNGSGSSSGGGTLLYCAGVFPDAVGSHIGQD